MLHRANQRFSSVLALKDVEAKFEQFTMDAVCTPKGILAAHLADEIPDFTRNDGPTVLAAPHLPSPEQAKGGAMPSHDGFRLGDGQR